MVFPPDQHLGPRSPGGIFPEKGTNVTTEITCYGLPYGGVGFTSHIITYYTMFLLSNGRSPWTWGKNKNWRFDCGLAIFALVATTATSIVTLFRCRNRWQFVCLAIWKICMSFMLTLLSLHAALLVSKKTKNTSAFKSGESIWNKDESVLAWIALYVPGLVAGLIALVSLVMQDWTIGKVKEVTLHFACMIFALLSLVVVIWAGSELERQSRKRMKYSPPWSSLPQLPFGRDKVESVRHVSPSKLLGTERDQGAAYSRGDHIRRIRHQVRGQSSRNYSYPLLRQQNQDSDFELSAEDGQPPSDPSAHLLLDGAEDAVQSQMSATNHLLVNAAAATSDKKTIRVTRVPWSERYPRLAGLETFLDFIKTALFSRSIRTQYKSGNRDGLGPIRLAGRISLTLGLSSVVLIGVFGALYCDFALGALALNMTGWPSSDNAALYWIYFAAKRLPLLFS